VAGRPLRHSLKKRRDDTSFTVGRGHSKVIVEGVRIRGTGEPREGGVPSLKQQIRAAIPGLFPSGGGGMCGALRGTGAAGGNGPQPVGLQPRHQLRARRAQAQGDRGTQEVRRPVMMQKIGKVLKHFEEMRNIYKKKKN